MNIIVKVIPHSDQRYDTVGDWWFDELGNLQIRVSELGNQYYEFLVAYHEQAEAILCKHRGIEEKDVSDFDIAWKGPGEPGDAEGAPYRDEHFTATTIERLMASELRVDWDDYDAEIELL